MSVEYEWDVEVVADGDSDTYEDGEVIEHFHQTCYADALKLSKQTPEPGTKYQICLVRDDDKGRSWSYFHEGKLQPFEDAWSFNVAQVPVRFLREVEDAS